MAKLMAPTTTPTLSRRTFLAAASALSFAPALARAGTSNDLDIAIIGGGVAGTYAAWRLALERPHLTTRLFEASDRIGGRLHSVAFPEAPHLVVEGGGMRFLDAHRHVSRLARTLELPTREFPVDRDANRMMLRGKNFDMGDVRSGNARFSYRIPDVDQTPDATFFDRAIANVLPGAQKMTAADWRKRRAAYAYKKRLLRNWRNRDLLLQGMSAEELAYSEDGSGYDDWIEGETGLDEMDYYFVHDDENQAFWTLVGGYQGLPLALAERAARGGVGVSTTERLVSLRATSNGFELAFRDSLDRVSSVTAAKVILALPRRALECIVDFPLAREQRFANLIASVTPIAACKSLLLYQRPWWRDHGIVEGRSITDMPARQFYCFGSEVVRRPDEAANGYGVLMAYCDEKSVSAWAALTTPNVGFTSLGGNSALAREVHRQAQLVIGATLLEPLAAYFQNWTIDPYGGGWHYYALGHDGKADAEAILKPMPDRELYVCGEAYSHSQGWVEGALERAETVLQRHFGLAPPRWLND